MLFIPIDPILHNTDSRIEFHYYTLSMIVYVRTKIFISIVKVILYMLYYFRSGPSYPPTVQESAVGYLHHYPQSNY